VRSVIMRSMFAGVFLVTGCVAWPSDLSAQRDRDPARLNRQIIELHNAGNYAEELPLVQRLVALNKARYGTLSTQHASALERLALNYMFQKRGVEAEPIYLQVIAIRTKLLGAHHEDVLSTTVALANLYRATGRPQIGEPLLKKAIAQRERAMGRNHVSLVGALMELGQIEGSLQHYREAEADIHRALALGKRGKQEPTRIALILVAMADLELNQRRFAEAERILNEALAIQEEAGLTNSPGAAVILLQLAKVYKLAERHEDAGLLAERVLPIIEKAFGSDHPQVAAQLEISADWHESHGRYDEGDARRKRALAIYERAYGRDSIDFAKSLTELGRVYGSQGRNQEALALSQRALEIAEKAFGPDSPDLYPFNWDIGSRYLSQGRYSDAEPFLMQALTGLEKAHRDPFVVGLHLTGILGNLAVIHVAQGHYAEARESVDRALTVSERVLGPNHTQFGNTLNTLGGLLLVQGQTDEAERLLERALPITERAGKDTSIYADTIAGLGMVSFQRDDWARAHAALKRASEIYIALDQRAAAGGATRADTGPSRSILPHVVLYFTQAFTAFRLAEKDATAVEDLRDDAFQMAQRVQSSQTAAALGQMAGRFSSGTSALAVLVRTRQDLGAEWQAIDARLTTALVAPPEQRDQAYEQALRQRRADLAIRLDALNARIATELPEYAGLAHPRPLTIADTRKLLGSREDSAHIDQAQGGLFPNEALILILQAPELARVVEDTFVWVITKTQSRWVRVDLGRTALEDQVQALRCGLDEEEWGTATKAARCGELLGLNELPDKSQPLPFDLGKAHELYQALFGKVADLISDKHLLIVPSGPLTSLPFQVLVTDEPSTALPKSFAGYRGVSWLGRRQPLTVLPSVASLQALRKFAKASAGKRAYLAYGNPALQGDGSCRRATVAETCAPVQGTSPKRGMRERGEVRGGSIDRIYRRGAGQEAVIAEVRSLCPLPETAFELRCVAKSLGVPESEIRLGEAASESDIKGLSESGELANYRVVHFATHGLLAGDTELMARRQGEPALVMTPPATPKDADDDGLLTASEVAQLKLNADWVILSACNTAAGDKLGAEALSGLARAFFYAGARTLLVSHWPVYSDAAVQLLDRTFAEIREDDNIGRSEAYRRAMIALIDDPAQADNPHPAIWAPFSIVGEGSSSKTD
jgi:CHAT domain-containing protein/tetratricopeptide (TPR) repeat protein